MSNSSACNPEERRKWQAAPPQHCRCKSAQAMNASGKTSSPHLHHSLQPARTVHRHYVVHCCVSIHGSRSWLLIYALCTCKLTPASDELAAPDVQEGAAFMVRCVQCLRVRGSCSGRQWTPLGSAAERAEQRTLPGHRALQLPEQQVQAPFLLTLYL